MQGLTPASGSYFVDCKTFFKTPMKRGLLLQIAGVDVGTSEARIPTEVDSLL